MSATLLQRDQASRLLPVMFGATLFGSAFLLFAVQPMVSRMVLPRLGGSPAVWNTCVCFFQAMLVLGYAYADWSALRLRVRDQILLHAVVLLAGLALMPLSIGSAVPSPDSIPAVWLFWRLLITIGPPFFAISATAPLVQHWFSRTDQPRAHDPYFLYAASNAGSLLALIAYPLLAEPFLDLRDQTFLWSCGFALCCLTVLGCGLAARRRPSAAPQPALPAAHADAGQTPLATQLRWMTLAFVPSGLMLAVTTYITTDIAATPLFWVIPLTIYILTFMLAFGRRQRAMPRYLPPMQAVCFAIAGFTSAMMAAPNVVGLLVAMGMFSITALVCHLELAGARPPASQLTRYFLLISIGGALGGLFNAFVAPMLFRGPWEYPLLLILACAVRPISKAAPVSKATDLSKAGLAKVARPVRNPGAAQSLGAARLAGIVAVGAVLLFVCSPYVPDAVRRVGQVVAIAVPLVALAWLSRRGAYLGVGLASLLILPLIVRATGAELSLRSFFGTYRVSRIADEGVTLLTHGTTIHGVQGEHPDEAATPYGYYDRGGPFGQLFAALHARPQPVHAIGVIGLGLGALGCYAQPGEQWTFREIDPAVERIARDDRFFHFMRSCGNTPRVVIGDARVTLGQDAFASYDLLVVDAFSSDSVPAHLLTREALALYFAHLAPGGIVAFHISNRYLDLEPVIARLAAQAGAPVRHIKYFPKTGGHRTSPVELMAIATPGTSLDPLTAHGWDTPIPGPILWTDQRSDIARVIRW